MQLNITPDTPIQDVMEQLERNIAEQTSMLNIFRTMMGQTPSNEKTSPDVTGSSTTSRAVTPARTARRQSSRRQANGPYLADHIVTVLKANPGVKSQPEIRELLRAAGVDVSRRNFLSAVYTAMIRKPEWFHRIGEGRWQLVGDESNANLPLIDNTSLLPAG